MLNMLDVLNAAAESLPANPLSLDRSVRGGNAGIVDLDGVVMADSHGSCLRNILLRAHGVSEPMDLRAQMTFSLGFAWEDLFLKLLKASPGFTDVQSQIALRDDTGPIPWTGTADFIATHGGKKILFDTKGVSSLSSYTKYIIDGTPKTSYVAQIVRYMAAAEIDEGYLVYGNFVYASKNHLTAGVYRSVGSKPIKPTVGQTHISIQGNSVYIDGWPWAYTVADVLAHTTAAKAVLETNTVAKLRPIPGPSDSYTPCGLCPFAKACSRFEAEGRQDTEAETFIQYAKESICT